MANSGVTASLTTAMPRRVPRGTSLAASLFEPRASDSAPPASGAVDASEGTRGAVRPPLLWRVTPTEAGVPPGTRWQHEPTLQRWRSTPAVSLREVSKAADLTIGPCGTPAVEEGDSGALALATETRSTWNEPTGGNVGGPRHVAAYARNLFPHSHAVARLSARSKVWRRLGSVATRASTDGRRTR